MTKTIATPNTGGYVNQSGDLVTYHITVLNTGNTVVTGLLTDIRPSELDFISSSPAVPTGATGLVISVPASGSFVITVTGVVNDNYPAGTVYTNTANFSCQFPTACNNASASVTGVVLGFGHLTVTKAIVAPNT